ncbi:MULTISPECIES: DNA polymerase III subunit epsilon [Psychrobacter]|jgi:ribonuclease HI/DNA polymerase-3 subunit epsilon|uniref:Ribonuclease H n=2 Tax=Psychrobacter TaxID=497 RepID=A0A1G6V1K7_9GAMM|nr:MULTISPECIES: DNA polymerase III subunit epsilon [Psychrobacter]HBD02987.1 DNA polymerase III subunit epsilon [Psychrobacter sp.]MDH4905157.1 DNA polymerase III subunit epsilon [Psychrobacter pocilloporae]SDD47383.1 ribonuclease HI / DNA polymerase-3 subunit epsilon [Psychrobacter pacificensis]GLR28272.1 ribonuclease H [Psychrobacter pacificensis]HCI31020.1 DNA polymerase III subunit epsilon [Psychrobacter sp.]|tara:strand:+ start:615 stop:2255 length:1641 start_codon:yes stop_codon:yes gene_type:complete
MSDNRNAMPHSNTSNATDPLAAKKNITVAYTDGACKGNPGAGGWGAHLIFSDGSTQDLYGGDTETTNNRMELMGAIQALTHSSHEQKLEIWTDSSYVQKGITEWIEGWKKKGWKTASKKPVANQDLWQQLDKLCQQRDVDWHWVKGHAGHAGNEKADELANLGVTSNSGHSSMIKESVAQKPVINESDAPKKKDRIATDKKPVANDDWLKFDPLGLDMVDDEFEDVSEDELRINDSQHSHEARMMHNDVMVETPHHPDNAPKMMSNKAMPEAQVPMNDTDMTSDIPPIDTDTPKFDGDTSRANPHFKPLLPKPIHRHEANRQLIMDTETTGLDALKGDRIIEIGIVEMVGRKFTGEKLHVYINPQRGMDDEVIRIHGISEAFLADKPTFDQVAQSLYDFMDGAEIIAHNATFDMNFLNMEFAKVGLNDFAERVQVTDSLVMAKQQYPGQKNTLDALVRRLDVGKQDRTFHGALLDSEILAEVYLAMTGGQVTLAIEEDAPTEGGQTAHTSFANLANLLLASTSDETTNQSWYASLAEDYPELKANM